SCERHKQVDATELALDPPPDRSHVVLAPAIARYRDRAIPEFGHECLELAPRAGVHGDADAVRDEGAAGRGTDSLRAARDERDLALEVGIDRGGVQLTADTAGFPSSARTTSSTARRCRSRSASTE